MVMPKNSWSFVVPELTVPIGVTRWGHFGMPVVLFASAGGDSLEAERLQLVASLAPLTDAGRIKVYAVDGTAMRMLLAGTAAPEARVRAQRAFDQWVESGLGPLVRRDCESDTLELLACGCALGAASAVQALLRDPQLFRGAIGLSGTYDLLPWLNAGQPWSEDVAADAEVSPLQHLARLADGPLLVRLRQRPITLACTAGDYDDPRATEAMAQRLRGRGIATRTDVWEPGFHFGFPSWCQMLPRFVADWL
jgi:esterase/lipase superfamily enzyme